MNFSEGRQGGCGRTPRTPPKSATDTVACAGQLATADTCFRQSLQQTNTRQALKSTEVDHVSNLSNQTRTHRIPIYRVGQKSKLSILSVYNVNKTQKTGGT